MEETITRSAWRKILAMTAVPVAGTLAALAWMAFSVLIGVLIVTRNDPNRTATFRAVGLMLPAVTVAFGFTAVTAWIRHARWGGRITRRVAIVATLAACVLLLPCFFWIVLPMAITFN